MKMKKNPSRHSFVMNTFELVTHVTNTNIFGTCVTNAFTFVTRTYLSHVTNSNESVTHVNNSQEEFARNTFDKYVRIFHTSKN